MAWQRSGTVSVQNGSTTVTGVNANFAASARSGDSFIGPDGLTYEVVNPASATSMSILPAYKGPTVSGAAYAIMPVQGYDKLLSDAFNTLVNQFGTKLAALGTTGNYDILPVEKGGLGNATGTAQKLLAAAMVGTATQSGGIATGAIIERGSNGNGEYIKFADGTLVCWDSKGPTLTTSNAIGQGYQSAPANRYDFPATFVGDANSVVVAPQVTYVSGPSQGWCTVSRKALNFANIIALGFQSGVEVRTAYLAIGRWF